MSLTADVKAELTAVRDPRPTARVAELTSLLRFSGGLHSIANRVAVAIEWRPPEKRRREVSSATRAVGLGSRTVISSAFTSAVSDTDLLGWVSERGSSLLGHRAIRVRGLDA